MQGARIHPDLAGSRRAFLKSAAVAGIAAGTLSIARGAHASGDDTLRVGLIGCGGRGSGAAVNALRADAHVKLTAMGDAFRDRLEGSLERLETAIGDKVDVPPERRFVGFDAYRQVVDSGVDVVIHTAPPHFRPAHLEYAVAAGKHSFVEKPVAVDAPGLRRVMAACDEASRRGLNIVSGLCYRYDAAKRETMARVHEGAIGNIVAMHVSYNTGPLWHHGRKDEWSDMEWQVRNWLYFTWLSGDHNVEQHIHSLDKAAWAMKDEPPIKCSGLGGRQVRTESRFGNVFDHFAVVYEYANGARLFANCRQMAGCTMDVSDYLLGTKGSCNVMKHSLSGEHAWRYRGPAPNMYQQEHDELFAAIRAGERINNGEYMCRSTLMALMGRMSAYTGEEISWDQALNSQEDLSPAAYEWGPAPEVVVAVPGITRFS